MGEDGDIFSKDFPNVEAVIDIQGFIDTDL